MILVKNREDVNIRRGAQKATPPAVASARSPTTWMASLRKKVLLHWPEPERTQSELWVAVEVAQRRTVLPTDAEVSQRYRCQLFDQPPAGTSLHYLRANPFCDRVQGHAQRRYATVCFSPRKRILLRFRCWTGSMRGSPALPGCRGRIW